MMLDKKAYREEGFLLVKNFFSKGEIEKIHEDAKAVFEAQIKRHNTDPADLSVKENFEEAMYDLFEKDFEAVVNCGKQAQHLVSLHRLGTDPTLIDALKSLGHSTPVISTRPVLFFNSRRLAKKEDYWRLNAHQDWRSNQGSLDSMTVWIPLIDIDKSLGCLEVIPRSHKWGLLDAEKFSYYGKILEELADEDFLPIEVERGDALFFSSFTIHRSGTNSTNAIRWSCHLRYNNLGEPTFIRRGYPHPYIYKGQEDLITKEFPNRELLQELFA